LTKKSASKIFLNNLQDARNSCVPKLSLTKNENFPSSNCFDVSNYEVAETVSKQQLKKILE
jgi:hypothetical protein